MAPDSAIFVAHPQLFGPSVPFADLGPEEREAIAQGMRLAQPSGMAHNRALKRMALVAMATALSTSALLGGCGSGAAPSGPGGRGGTAAGSGGASSGGGASGSGGLGAAGASGGGGAPSSGGGSGSGGTAGGGGKGNAGASGGGASATGGTAQGGSGGGGTPGTGGKGGAGGGGVCTYGGITHPAGTTFPDPDGCNTCTCASGGQIGCTDRACMPDGGMPPACALDMGYRYGPNGGFVAYSDESTLTPPAAYKRERRPNGSTTVSKSCSPALPACDTADAVDLADILRDLADADVQKALAAKAPPLYGYDSRPVDGSVFSVLRADGRGFLMGGPCPVGTGTCMAIPPGITKLAQDLVALDQEQLKDPSCAPLR